jgi:hypothetical protein
VNSEHRGHGARLVAHDKRRAAHDFDQDCHDKAECGEGQADRLDVADGHVRGSHLGYAREKEDSCYKDPSGKRKAVDERGGIGHLTRGMGRGD